MFVPIETSLSNSLQMKRVLGGCVSQPCIVMKKMQVVQLVLRQLVEKHTLKQRPRILKIRVSVVRSTRTFGARPTDAFGNFELIPTVAGGYSYSNP